MDLFIVIAGIAGVLLLFGSVALGRRWNRWRRRVLLENALKQICSAEHEGRSATPSQIAIRLGLSSGAMLRLVTELASAGLVQSEAGTLKLTPTGERLGLHVLRGHRLWEQYLSAEGQLPLHRLHEAAERAEHRLSAEDVEALADHLGHPRVDPHGDVIPTAAGELESRACASLTDWPLNRLAVVVHVEDEPRRVLTEVLRAGLQPGTVLRVVARDEKAIIFETSAGRRSSLVPAAAAGVDVRPAAEGEGLGKPLATLASLPLGEQADVVALSKRCTGLRFCAVNQGRMLDLEQAALGAVLTQHGWTTLTAVSLMLFSLLHNPCGTTIWTIWRETRSVRWTVFGALMPLAIAIVVCGIVATATRAILAMAGSGA